MRLTVSRYSSEGGRVVPNSRFHIHTSVDVRYDTYDVAAAHDERQGLRDIRCLAHPFHP
jgi:hypothetical protein